MSGVEKKLAVLAMEVKRLRALIMKSSNALPVNAAARAAGLKPADLRRMIRSSQVLVISVKKSPMVPKSEIDRLRRQRH